MSKRKIILDVDTGTDDAIAIMLANCSEELDLVGVCTVNGNRGIQFTTENTLRVRDFLGAEFPVYRGCYLPIASTLIKGRRDRVPWTGMENESENVHGDYLELPKSKSKAEQKDAVSWLVETLLETDEPMTIVPVGPLTNIATALRIDPRIKDNIDEIVIMGGGHLETNITASAEFNFWIDPEAAKIVLESGCKITLVPLDATHAAAVSTDLMQKLLDSKTPIAMEVANIMKTRLDGYNRWQPMEDQRTVPIHDALAVAYLLDPMVLKEMVFCNVDVDVSGGLCDGRSVCDVHKKDARAKSNCTVALSADRERFEEILYKKFGGR